MTAERCEGKLCEPGVPSEDVENYEKLTTLGPRNKLVTSNRGGRVYFFTVSPLVVTRKLFLGSEAKGEPLFVVEKQSIFLTTISCKFRGIFSELKKPPSATLLQQDRLFVVGGVEFEWRKRKTPGMFPIYGRYELVEVASGAVIAENLYKVWENAGCITIYDSRRLSRALIIITALDVEILFRRFGGYTLSQHAT